MNQYEGDFDITNIPPIKDGAEEFVKKLTKNYELKLFTTRNRLLTAKWLMENHIDKCFTDITNIKDPAWLIIDDRCIKFQGDYKVLYNEIEKFKVWYKI